MSPEKPTLQERLVTAFGMLLVAGVTSLLLWFLIAFAATTPVPVLLPVSFTLAFVVWGFLFPSHSVEKLGKVWREVFHLLKSY